MIGVDLFAGSGGLSLGAVMAGVDVRLAVEADPLVASTYAQNHPGTKIRVEDVRALPRIPIVSKEVTILFGGPPCQGFSTSNQRTRKVTNATNWLFIEFLRILRSWKPRFVLFENVPGIKETAGGFFLHNVTIGIQSLGYAVSTWVLNAADFGVPQRRRRLFVVGSQDGIVVPEPRPTCPTPVTVRQAIWDLPDLSNGASIDRMPYRCKARSDYAVSMRGSLTRSSNHLVTRNSPAVLERFQHVPPGGNWRNIPARLMRDYGSCPNCHTGLYYRLREDSPSIVVSNCRKSMLIHPARNRGLSVREAARLQSFPDWYEFKGSIGFQQQQVANAVPPLLAQAVFDAIRSACHNQDA